MTHRSGKQAPKKIVTAAFAGMLLGLLCARAVAEPTPREVLEQAQALVRTQQYSLAGQIRTGPEEVPFQLDQTEGKMRYSFSNPDEVVAIDLTAVGPVMSGAPDPAAFVRGSFLSYEDLTLRFLFWTDVEDRGVEKIRGLPCWKIRVATQDRKSPYSVVLIWINRQSGALIRAQAFDWNGVFVKQFDVISTQKIEGSFFLKQMKIQLQKPVAPGGGTLSYLEILPPKN